MTPAPTESDRPAHKRTAQVGLALVVVILVACFGVLATASPGSNAADTAHPSVTR